MNNKHQQHSASANQNIVNQAGASHYTRRAAQESAASFTLSGKAQAAHGRPFGPATTNRHQHYAFNKHSYSAMGNNRDHQKNGVDTGNGSGSKVQSAFLQAAYRDDNSQQINKSTSSRGQRNFQGSGMQQQQTMDETRLTSEGRNNNLQQTKYAGGGDTSDRYTYGASPKHQNAYGSKFTPYGNKGGMTTTANESQRISYLQSESSFKSARVSAIGRNFESNREQYQTDNRMVQTAGSVQSTDMPNKQTAFQGYKRSMQIMPYNKIDMSKQQSDNGPAQTYWQFKKDGPSNQGTHSKSSSTDLNPKQRNPSVGSNGLNSICNDGSYQNTDRGPVTYQRAAALTSPQAQFAPPKRLNTQKMSVLSASSDNRKSQQPYLANLRGKKSVNNYQNQKKVLGQTIDDSEAASIQQGDPDHKRQGPKTGMRPSMKPAGPQIVSKKNNDTHGWTSARKGDYPLINNERPSEVREEEQPYYMRAPFNASTRSYNDQHMGGAHTASISPNRNQAAAHYGLMQYSNRGISPRGKGPSRPGTSLGGRIGIRKLSKLDAKEQDDVHEVTEDEDRIMSSPGGAAQRTDIPPAHSREPYQSNNSNFQTPFNKAENGVEIQRGPGREGHLEPNQQQSTTRKAYTFGKPNSAQRTLQIPVETTDRKKVHNSHKTKLELEESSDPEDNQQLRQEYLKVKRELEMLKKTGRQKMRSPIPTTTQKGKSMIGGRGVTKERPTSSQCLEQQDLRRPIQRMAQQQEPGYRKGKDVSPKADDMDALEDPIRQKFEDTHSNTRKNKQDSFNQDDFYLLSSKSQRENQGMWQDKVEERIEKLNQRLSDYYQRANPDDENAGSGQHHATPTATEGTDGVFRGSFSRSASINRFQNPQQTMTGNRIQFQSSATSSQQSLNQQSNGNMSPSRSKTRVTPKATNSNQQQTKGKKYNQQIHGLYSAAGARVASPQRRPGARKSSAGSNIGNGISKSMKSTPLQNNPSQKPGLKPANSYKDVQVIEINDSRVVGDGAAKNLGQNQNNNQAVARSIIAQNSQAALIQSKQNLPKKAKGKNGGLASSQRRDMLLKASRSGDQKNMKSKGMEFRGSFQNKGHRLWAATPLDTQPDDSPRQKTKSRRQQPLNAKSFNSDRSAGSDYDDGYDRQGPEYSASASNNSEVNNRSDQGNREGEDDSSNDNEQSTIGTQYSQIVNIRTKHRHGISSRLSKGKSSQRARKKVKASEEQSAEKNDKRWPVTTIDLESGRRTARGTTPDYTKKARQSARDGSGQPKQQSDQAQVIFECQKQIQELQAQLQNLTHFPPTGGAADTTQGSVLLMNQQQRQNPMGQGMSISQANATMQSQDIMMQRSQFNGSVQVNPNQLTYGVQTPTGGPSMHMGINTNSMLGQHPMQFQGNTNPHSLHSGSQMNPMHMQSNSQPVEFQQYELKIRQLHDQIREQQLQLQFQEQKHEQALWTHRTIQGHQPHPSTPTVEQSNQLLITTPQSSVPYQGLSPIPDLLHGSTIPNQHHQLAGTAAAGAPQLASFTTPMTPMTPIAPTHHQRPGSGIGICQFLPPDTSNITQNNSNFFSQINEIARNIDERGGQQIPRGGSIDTIGLSAEKFGARDDTLVQVVVQDDDEVDAADVQHETDMEMTELDAAKIGSAVRPDAFTGFETSIVDTYTREARPSMRQKGSFAPLPENDDQILEEQSEYSSKKRQYDDPIMKDTLIEENYKSGTFSPEFVVRGQNQPIQWMSKKDDKTSKESTADAVKFQDPSPDKDEGQSGTKQEQLLIFGFDEKPKGINPLQRLRSPNGIGANERSRQKPQMNIFNPRGGKTLGESSKNTAGRVTLEISQSSRTSHIQASQTPKGHPIAKINLQQSTDDNQQDGTNIFKFSDNQSNQKPSEVIQIGDDIPSLQEYARLKSGRIATKMQSSRRNHVSPQPRKSNAFNQGSGVSSNSISNNPFSQRQDKSQPPKQAKETKTKEELARIRKEMMKSKFKDRNEHLNKSPMGLRDGTIETSSGFIFTTQGNLETESNIPGSRLQKGDHPRVDLMSRLASGTKAKVDKQSMRRLTKDNYQKLPEIQKKKEEAKRQEELFKKKERAAAYQKELDMRLRNSLRKKKEKDAKR